MWQQYGRGIARKVVCLHLDQLTPPLVRQFGKNDATPLVDPGPLDNLIQFLIATFIYHVSNVAPEKLHFQQHNNEEEEVGFGLVRQFAEGCNWISSSVMQRQLANKKRTELKKQNLTM